MAWGRVLTFHLAGINNQNFLMRDEETGSYWQQISGKAVSGPMTGAQLEPVYSDELSFGLWRKENPQGTVLRPVVKYASDYEPKDWEKRIGKARTVVDTRKTGIAARALMFGMELGGASRAYPAERVLREGLVQDMVGGKAVILVVGPDAESVRAFAAQVPRLRDVPEFYRKQGEAKVQGPGALFLDSVTGGEWNFTGCAVTGSAAGRCLAPVQILKDYWFDWHLYHPHTTVYGK